MAPGYRGSLPPRTDRLAAPWVITVAAVFVLVLALSAAGLPSKLLAGPSGTPNPSASITPSGSPAASGVAPSPSP
jgi:hypothetical protein